MKTLQISKEELYAQIKENHGGLPQEWNDNWHDGLRSVPDALLFYALRPDMDYIARAEEIPEELYGQELPNWLWPKWIERSNANHDNVTIAVFDDGSLYHDTNAYTDVWTSENDFLAELVDGLNEMPLDLFLELPDAEFGNEEYAFARKHGYRHPEEEEEEN